MERNRALIVGGGTLAVIAVLAIAFGGGDGEPESRARAATPGMAPAEKTAAPAEWLRRWAQGVAERRHAASRRQTELSEDRLRKSMAFSGASE